MKILVIDDENRWGEFCLKLGFAVIGKIEPEVLAKTNYDLYIVSDRQPLALLSALQDKKFIIATGQPTSRNAIKAYRLGAIDYMAKDKRPDVIMAKVKGAV